MKIKAFALLDMKVQAFHAPFFLVHEAQAIRACADLAADTSTVVGRHPADFVLMEIGVFDDQRGTLEGLVQPIQHGIVSSFIEAKPQTGLFRQMADGQVVEIKREVA